MSDHPGRTQLNQGDWCLESLWWVLSICIVPEGLSFVENISMVMLANLQITLIVIIVSGVILLWLLLCFACPCMVLLRQILCVGLVFVLSISSCVCFSASYRWTWELNQAPAAALLHWQAGEQACHPGCSICVPPMQAQIHLCSCHGCFDSQGSEFFISELSGHWHFSRDSNVLGYG